MICKTEGPEIAVLLKICIFHGPRTKKRSYGFGRTGMWREHAAYANHVLHDNAGSTTIAVFACQKFGNYECIVYIMYVTRIAVRS
jgi:hypothetical protein